MIKETLSKAKSSMEKALEAAQHELASIRTGRASLGLLDTIRVDYYGSALPLNQVASLGVPEPSLITIQPWDRNMIPVIEKQIRASSLGLNPVNDGVVIKLPIPQPSEERRKDLVRLARKLGEEARIAVRNVRRDANEHVKKAEKEGEISEDNSHDAQAEIQELTDHYVRLIDEMLETKEAEIMEV